MSVIALPSNDLTAPRLLHPSSPPKRPHTLTPKQLAANRANALRSTGPRTPAGKAKVSRNATTHGLSQPTPTCRPHASHEETDPDFANFLEELRTDLRPRSVLQHHLFPLIADLLWRLRRLPHAQQHLFSAAAAPTTDGDPGDTPSPPCQTLANAFLAPSAASNPFLLLGRYERSMHNALIRLLTQYRSLEKDRLAAAANPRSQYDPDERPCPPEPALRPDNPCFTGQNPVHRPALPIHWVRDPDALRHLSRADLEIAVNAGQLPPLRPHRPPQRRRETNPLPLPQWRGQLR